jgi:hypothetical protein
MSLIVYIQMSALSSNFPKSAILHRDLDRQPGHLSANAHHETRIQVIAHESG